MPPKKNKKAKKAASKHTAPAASPDPSVAPALSTSVPNLAPAGSKEAAILFWVREAVKPKPRLTSSSSTSSTNAAATTASTTPSNLLNDKPVEGTGSVEAESVPAKPASSAGRKRPDRSPSAPAAPPTERNEATHTTEVQQQPPASSSAVHRDAPSVPTESPPRQVPLGRPSTVDVTLRDVMPLYDHLQEGLLGPVAIDVEILGQASLLRDPEGFQRALEAAEPASTGPLQTLLRSVKLFFFTRGGGLYTMDTSVFPALPTLAALLMAPKVQKIVANAGLLYRLLFLFLGTDRVEVANVVDIGTWSTVIRQNGSTSQSQRQRLLPATASDVLVHAARLLDALPHETQSLLSAQSSGVVVYDKPSTSALSLTKGRRSPTPPAEQEPSDSGDGGLTPPLKAANAVAAKRNGNRLPSIPTREEAESSGNTNARPAVDDLLRHHGSAKDTSRTKWSRGEGAASRRNEMASQALARTFLDLASMFSYHDTYLRPLENSAIVTTTADPRALPLPDDASPQVMRTVADLCASRTYALFLCAVMTFHGVSVSRDGFEHTRDHLTEQVAELAEAGARLVDDLAKKGLAPSSPSVDFKSDVSSRSLGEFIVALLQRQGGLQELSRSVTRLVSCFSSTASSSSAAAQRDGMRSVLQHLTSSPAPVAANENSASQPTTATAAETFVRGAAARLVRLWLAIEERASYRDGPLDKLFRGLGHHLRTSVVVPPDEPDRRQNADAGSAPERAPVPTIAYSVHPSWCVHGQSTGRIFASAPNVQTIAKESPTANFCLATLTQPTATAESEAQHDDANGKGSYPLVTEPRGWTLRHLYVAPRGCLFASLDFNQIELRVLAHLSGDPALLRSLSDASADVLAAVANLVFRCGDPAHVTAQQRQSVKVIVYGLIYGMGPELLDERLKKLLPPTAPSQGADGAPRVPSARELIKAVFDAFPGVNGYLRQSRLRALHEMQTHTLSGVKDLSSEPDPNRRKQRAVAWAVQGGAADILHAAMRAVHRQRHALLPFFPAAPLALQMTVHDELIYAIPTAAVDVVVPQLKAIVEAQGSVFGLRVPLRVSVKVGPSLGELSPY